MTILYLADARIYLKFADNWLRGVSGTSPVMPGGRAKP